MSNRINPIDYCKMSRLVNITWKDAGIWEIYDNLRQLRYFIFKGVSEDFVFGFNIDYLTDML